MLFSSAMFSGQLNNIAVGDKQLEEARVSLQHWSWGKRLDRAFT